MTSKLGVYWSVEHRRQSDYAYFKALQPSVFKIMDGGAPDYQFGRDNLPGALVIARDWALSEQQSDMLRDPVGTGQRHAREWNEHQPRLGFDKANTLILGINEPHIWEPDVAEALRQYTIALCDEAHMLGLRVGAMQLSVGWPNNNGADTPPDWSPFSGVQEAILRGNHALVTHEYWADHGPSENWGWWAGRTLKCPWQVPMVVGETGVDMFVKDTSVGQQNRGWVGHMPPERYAAELAEYTSRMSADPRFVGCCVFASDFQAHEWYSFDVEPAYRAILATPIPDTKPSAPPVTTHLPAIGNGTADPAQPQPTYAGIIDPRVAQAILKVESGGRAFGNDGKPLIRFEAHIFKSQLKNDALWAEHFQVDPSVPWTNQMYRRSPGDPWRQIHTGSQADEYAALDIAKSINPDAAYNSISVGAGQIMGFNHERVGWPSAAAMFDAFRDANMQTFGFINYFLSDPALVQAMRDKDWRTVAAKYNGSGNVDAYSKLLEQAYGNLGAA